jgi:hypothetical protein
MFDLYADTLFELCKQPEPRKGLTQELITNSNIFICQMTDSVARWYIFKPKIPIWVYLKWHCNRKCFYILWHFGG